MLLDAYNKTNDNGTKADLTRVFIRRAGTIAVPACEAGLKSDDENLRQISIQFLETVGQQSSIPALVDRYFTESKNDLRNAIERAIVQIESRYSDEDGRNQMFCDAIAKRNEKEQVQLLPVVGKIGGINARKFILDQYTNGKPAVREAAFAALCNWTDAFVAAELFQVASSPTGPRAASAARAYIRVVTLSEDGRSDKDKLAFVEKAMSVAKSDDDRRFLLTRLEQSRSIEVFRFAVKYINDPNLAQTVFRAVVDMANDTGFYTRNRAEIDSYLDKVIEKLADNNHVERAKRHKVRH
jgi:HEAT repeat protein